MISTSSDILNLVLATCIAILTFFLCWAIYYFIASVRRINRITKRVESGVAKAEEVIGIAKDKLKSSSAYVMVLGELAKRAMEYIKDKSNDKKEKAAAKKAKKK